MRHGRASRWRMCAGSGLADRSGFESFPESCKRRDGAQVAEPRYRRATAQRAPQRCWSPPEPPCSPVRGLRTVLEAAEGQRALAMTTGAVTRPFASAGRAPGSPRAVPAAVLRPYLPRAGARAAGPARAGARGLPFAHLLPDLPLTAHPQAGRPIAWARPARRKPASGCCPPPSRRLVPGSPPPRPGNAWRRSRTVGGSTASGRPRR